MNRPERLLYLVLIAGLTVDKLCWAAEQEFERLLQEGNDTEGNVTNSPTVSPTPFSEPNPTNPPAESNDDGDTVILALGVVGFILFFAVVGFFVYNVTSSSKPVADTTGGDVLGAGAGYNPTAAPAVKAVSPLESLQAGDRGSVSTIFSTDSHMSVNSGFYSGKVEADEGKDDNLMSLLKGKREEHNKRKGKKNKPPNNSENEAVGKANMQSMQEIADL